MKIIKPFISVLFLLIFASCERLDSQKIKTTTISGQVRTYGTEEPVKGAPVSVMLWREFDRSNQGFEMVDSVRTDENGFYTISQDLRTDERYFMSVDNYSYKLYIQSSWLSPSFSRRAQVTVGENQTIHLEPVAYGYVNFHFINNRPKPSDRFSYSVGGGGFEELYGITEIYRVWDFGGNLEHDIVIGKTENGVDSVWRQYFTPPAFDTLQLRIEF